jgi:ABC-2 type transport system ATP-binding protein
MIIVFTDGLILHTYLYMSEILRIQNVSKQYDNGFQALSQIDLNIQKGEIFALLGPNGAGKTTLIHSICGIVTPTEGKITVDGWDTRADYRQARKLIGLVPQELTIDTFATVWNTVTFSRGLFGKKKDPERIEQILRDLSLWDKKDQQLLTLSGGMKRRVLIAKALAHEPQVLFLDEPTAGVDVELRKNMWGMVRKLRQQGVTIILTTHYIQEAEEMADRIGVISQGKMMLVEDKDQLMKKMGRKQVIFDLHQPRTSLPEELESLPVTLSANGQQMIYTYDKHDQSEELHQVLGQMSNANLQWDDFSTKQSTLEEIFVEMVEQP